MAATQIRNGLSIKGLQAVNKRTYFEYIDISYTSKLLLLVVNNLKKHYYQMNFNTY